MLEDGVRGNRSAVHDFDNLSGRNAVLGKDLSQPVDDCLGVVLNARRDLLDHHRALLIEEHDVGKGPADVHPDAKSRRHRLIIPSDERPSTVSPLLAHLGSQRRGCCFVD